MTQAAKTGQPRFESIDIALLIPTPDNPRIVNESSPEFAELLDSVKRDGVKIPVVIRPHPKQSGKFDLRAGARRTRAATKAGLKVIPALVYDNMTDAEAFDITFLENFAREDLQPLEEARAVAIMLEKHGNDYSVVADKFGKTQHWVHLRSNVNKNLAPEWLKELAKEGNLFSRWTISHLEQIARFDKNSQVRLLKEMLSRKWRYEDISLKDLQKDCGEQLRNLKKAPWKMDAVLSDSAGKKLPVCEKCCKRSGCQPGLWDEKEDGGKEDRCLDVSCWDSKNIAVTCSEIEKQKKIHSNLRVIDSSGGLGSDYKEKIQAASGQKVANSYEYTSAKKGEKGAFPCFQVSGTSKGRVVWMKSCNGGSSAKSEKKTAITLKDRRDMLEKKRWSSVLGQLKDILDKTPVEMIVHEDKLSTIAILISIYGTTGDNSEDGDGRKKYLGKAGFRDSKDCDKTVAALWELLKPRLDDEITYNGPITQTPDYAIIAAKEVAALIGVDVSALFKTACEEFKEPRAWAKLEK